MNNKELEGIKSRIKQENTYLDDAQLEKIIKVFNRLLEDTQAEQQQKIHQLEDELYHLRIEKSKYQLLLTQRFQDKHNQTIAYQFGRLILDFLQHPIRHFITPKALLSIYAEHLTRKQKKHTLTSFEKRWVKWYEPFSTKKVVDDTFETLVNTPVKPLEESAIQKTAHHSKQKRKAFKLNFAHKTAKDLKVAVILDEFSFNSFQNEFTPIIITPNNWKAVFSQQKPDLFFCESAWSGTDSVTRPWKGKIYASVNFQKENRTELLEIIDYCDKNGIPTVFWNKEDPTHYPDRVHDFVKTACLFDFVFTTAQECVELYQKEYGLKNVYALPFATNPAVFNPIDNPSVPRTEKIVFAGSWYANHVERSKTMYQLFDSLIDSGYELEFYNRYYGDNDPNHLIPEQYQEYEKPSVSNKETSRIYKSSLFGLNLNTVVDSDTMFARRVFELMSSNTLVLSNYSKGMDRLFGKNVIFLDTEPNRLKDLDNQTIERIREENLNNVLANHTYQKRFETILDTVGVVYNKQLEKVTLAVKVTGKLQLKAAIRLFQQKFSHPQYRLLAVLDDNVSGLESAELYTDFNYGKINVLAESYLLRYGKQNTQYLDTPYFVLTDNLEVLNPSVVEKALLHSSYLSDGYIALTPHKNQKYIFESTMNMNHIFASAKKFSEAVKYFKQAVELPVYYINKHEGK
ncbi:CgeB family protein [Neisseria canis]|uniref:Uncharacterized protein conserved in bacteria n=1 Tax=Neisseria canis TaxID=493 RepID=A0A448D6Y1_9NEIS|nr:glycosyltransferase [Neisseria canis]OSI09334.1 hypothetical protein BWD07_11700 [Neisseria canis]VEF00310.1 Uncharacterized protein conserved in bacteria [Neisseria canis]